MMHDVCLLQLDLLLTTWCRLFVRLVGSVVDYMMHGVCLLKLDLLLTA